MDRLQAMEIFVAVVDESGFASAARRLKLPAPAVTRAVAELESRLGVRLLHRTTRVVRVTDAGARFAADCRRLLAEVDDAEDAAAGTHLSPRGHLTITASVLFGAKYVAPIVTRFLTQYPEVTASCWFVDRVVGMLEEGVDVAVRIGELPDSSLHAIPVGAVRRVICGSPAYLAAAGTPTRPEDLLQHTIVSASGVSSDREWKLRVAGALTPVEIRPRMNTTSNDAAITAALGGFGLVQLLSYQVAEHLKAGTLRTVLAEHEPPPLPVHVVHGEGRQAAQKVRAFLDMAVAALRENPSLR
jgi:DNA-binding transcriptional LysR family regulator